MRACITWLLILLTVHAPLPCPDLDGECQGTPIESLAEMQAWHVLLLGVRPADDIDRGPIHPTDPDDPATPDETPFGKLAVVSAGLSSTTNSASFQFFVPRCSDHGPLLVDASLIGGGRSRPLRLRAVSHGFAFGTCSRVPRREVFRAASRGYESDEQLIQSRAFRRGLFDTFYFSRHSR